MKVEAVFGHGDGCEPYRGTFFTGLSTALCPARDSLGFNSSASLEFSLQFLVRSAIFYASALAATAWGKLDSVGG